MGARASRAEEVLLKVSSSMGRLALAPALGLMLSGCLGIGGDPAADPAATAAVTPAAAEAGELDVRRYLGPDYCPEIRIREGTELVREFLSGSEEDPAALIWQASVGKTARECLYDGKGGLLLRVGVSGRVVTGPKGGAQTVSLPLRIALVKYQEAVIASELYPLSIAIPQGRATVFSEVRELNVPAPGSDRDLILYVGFDEKGENLLDPAGAIAVAEDPEPERVAGSLLKELEKPASEVPPPPPRKKVPPKPAAPAQPNVLPVPSGFVLPGG
jgi:hypothetical protein